MICLSLTASAQSHHKHSQQDLKNRWIVGVGGAAFTLFGALKQPEQRWVSQGSYHVGQTIPTNMTTNSYGNQYGYWRTEYLWENPVRSACVITGVILMTVSLTIKF